MSTSPFLKYRDMVLGYYSTASWLRRVIMAMWNGTDYKTGLSQSWLERQFDDGVSSEQAMRLLERKIQETT